MTTLSMGRLIILVSLVLLGQRDGIAQTFVLSGEVRDAESRERLAATTIRVVGSSKGTITNSQGAYKLTLERGEYRLAFSYIGYETDTLRIVLDRNLERNIELQPSAVQMAEVVVSGEDPAIRIMRQVIERKHRWMEALKSYQFDAFTRQVLRRDTAIASIAETYSTGYWQTGDTLREVIRQKRQTENIPVAQNLASVGGIVNFYQDEIRFGGFRFLGPTAPDAFDYYDFKLEKTRETRGTTIFVIRMTPKTRLTPLFYGTINIVDESFSVAGVDVWPNEAYAIPFVSDLRIRYAQQFALFQNEYWMPVDIRITGEVELGIAGLSFPKIGIEGISSIYDYRINTELPDSIFQKPRRTVAQEASKFDSSFWAQREVLPLTGEEQEAYAKIDSTQTLEKQFKPSGPLLFLGNTVETFARYGSLRFNRVEGLYLEGDVDVDSLTNSLRSYISAGYGFSDEKAKWKIGSELFLDELRRFSLGVEGYDSFVHTHDENYHSDLGNALTSLLAKNDYRDYYYTKGWKLFVKARPAQKVFVQLNYQNEEHRTALQHTDYSFFSRARLYRPNPAIQDGMLQSISLKTRYGNDPLPFNIIPTDFVELEWENANPSVLKSDFEYSRLLFRAEYHVATLLRSLFFPPTLSVRVTAGGSFGVPPTQKYFSLDSQSSGFAPFGVLRGATVKEFSGDQFVLISLEHNFRSTPFLALNIPFLYKNSVELIVHGTFARSWFTTTATPMLNSTDGWYAEAGFGISRVLGFFRFDLTNRFMKPSNLFFTVGIATF